MSDAIGGVIGIAFAVILIWALYPVMVQIAGLGYAVLFMVFAILLVAGSVLGLLKR